jgi:hypothetical protein
MRCFGYRAAAAGPGLGTGVQVTMEDFEKALEEVKPAFGTSTETLESYLTHGIIPCGETFEHLRQTLAMLTQQVRQLRVAGGQRRQCRFVESLSMAGLKDRGLRG